MTSSFRCTSSSSSCKRFWSISFSSLNDDANLRRFSSWRLSVNSTVWFSKTFWSCEKNVEAEEKKQIWVSNYQKSSEIMTKRRHTVDSYSSSSTNQLRVPGVFRMLLLNRKPVIINWKANRYIRNHSKPNDFAIISWQNPITMATSPWFERWFDQEPSASWFPSLFPSPPWSISFLTTALRIFSRLLKNKIEQEEWNIEKYVKKNMLQFWLI